MDFAMQKGEAGGIKEKLKVDPSVSESLGILQHPISSPTYARIHQQRYKIQNTLRQLYLRSKSSSCHSYLTPRYAACVVSSINKLYALNAGGCNHEM